MDEDANAANVTFTGSPSSQVQVSSLLESMPSLCS